MSKLEEEESIFAKAIQIASKPAREAYLKEACGQDQELYGRVKELIECSDHANGLHFLESAGTPPGEGLLSEGPGAVIGQYKLLERLGEGGFGVVYMAEQQRPLKRQVALKVIKPGMDTRQVIRRFEAERQALAVLDHPNIARVYDAGATDSGRPYFVMELVHGTPITEYCDQRKLTIEERLDLFTEVCSAIEHAHQKGIIHRDLKPSNILINLGDGKPKVIDFGVSKATGQPYGENALSTTGNGQLVGTPQYIGSSTGF